MEVTGLDARGPHAAERGDVCEPDRIAERISGCEGVIHLAGVSRVVWGQQDPDLCWRTNVGGTQNILDAVAAARPQPWLVFASSREVYGEPEDVPVSEDAPRRPINAYAESKLEAERRVLDGRRAGLRTAVVRLSNVFGSVHDHADRVVPAFARATTLGAPMRVRGPDHVFDFTHVSDVVRGIIALSLKCRAGAEMPPIHLVSGRGTTLEELAGLMAEVAGTPRKIVLEPERDYDVKRFVGNPERASLLLGWQPRVELRDGMRWLVDDFKHALGASRASVRAAS